MKGRQPKKPKQTAKPGKNLLNFIEEIAPVYEDGDETVSDSGEDSGEDTEDNADGSECDEEEDEEEDSDDGGLDEQIAQLEKIRKNKKLKRLELLKREIAMEEEAIKAGKRRLKDFDNLRVDSPPRSNPSSKSKSTTTKAKPMSKPSVSRKPSSRSSRGSDRQTATGYSTGVTANPEVKFEFDVNTVRADPKVKDKLVRALCKAGLNDIFDFKASSGSIDSSDCSDTDSVLSGRSETSFVPSCSKAVPVLWPHQVISSKYTDFSQKKLRHSQLDIRMFNIGELEIISSADIGSDERLARTVLLKELNHFAGLYEWRAILKLHSTVLSEISKGVRTWSDPLDNLMHQILMPYRLPAAKPVNSNKTSSVWYCADYNKEESCSKPDNHKTLVNGENVSASHICAKCWITDKKRLHHPRISPDCPHFSE
jgi:hypothetical protein